ncbi:excalibur calcium-binding domain-containing protein [Nocardioides sp. zg-1228]|uniref:excalibur calcium-binding domain-containing protein n=1 Tax=Nocardioides sp. zg-1228 TaxID=2763008 RepID=UPI00197F02DE|nr:excalibur calcium-binding domain-containing protein [Nocardioides sp. zg-1228]QSF56709.1 excalibur calcium-binding domain-containing protein [Nocardioides sp. zg-1228]
MLDTIVRALALAVVALGLSATAPALASAVVDRDCGDFASQAAAQHFFLGAGAGDPHRLDDDGDGVACESNPCPCIGRGTTSPQQHAGNSQQQGPRTYRETGDVVRITDGDTLRVRLRSGAHVSVRMLGIDTPERGRCGADAATANLRRLAPVGSTVTLVSDRTQAAKDRYGRLLRYVGRKGGYGDLSFRQAWDGHTRPYVFGGKPVARHREYVRAIDHARTHARGAWASCW